MATYTTYDQVGKKEDVSDIISDISPLDTPMFTLMKSEKSQARVFEWQEDAMRASNADNAIVEGLRQTAMTKKKIEHWAENVDKLKEIMSHEEYRNYQRNKKLIDLGEIPEAIQSTIINTFVEQKPAMKMKVLNYLIKKRCNLLIECAEEFYNG